MFNSLKGINKAFDYILEEEKKLYYEYEPYFQKRNESWKRHLFFFELKKDFIKDVTEFGFCPYIQKSCEEQRRDKNIMRFKRADNFAKTDYIKNLYKKISNNINNNQKHKSLSPEKKQNKIVLKKNKSMKDFTYNNKYKNTLLFKNYSKINKNIKVLDNCKQKTNIDINKNTESNNKKINKDDGQMDIDSFVYEPNNNARYNNKLIKDSDEYNNKDESISDSVKNKTNNQLVNNKSFYFDLNNFKINKTKKKGWRMTTTLDKDKFFRNLKSALPFNENNDKNFVSFLGDNQKFINKKFGNENYKNNYNNRNLNLNSGHFQQNKKNKIYNKKLISYHKSKSTDKKFKLFSHIRKMRNEFENI